MLASILVIQGLGWLLVNIISKDYRVHRLINIIVSVITLYIGLYILLVFNTNNVEYQYREEYTYTDTLGLTLGLDGISLTMLILLSLLDPILILLSRGEVKKRHVSLETQHNTNLNTHHNTHLNTHHNTHLNTHLKVSTKGGIEVSTKGGIEVSTIVGGTREEGTIEEKRINNYIMGIKVIMYILFMCVDILVFFIMYELVLIPIFLLITKYGSKYRYYIPRVEAGMRLFIYTIIGSLFMLVAIAYLYSQLGSTSNEIINIGIINLLTNPAKEENLKYVWLFIFLAFLIKVPMYPLHSWLPLAHSDAPTIGSIILAALLLKLASYGIIRYSIGIYTISLSNGLDLSIIILLIQALAIISIINSAIIALRALYDLKKIIAYSSIVHMNFSIFGFFSRDIVGLIGATYLIHTHALISSCLFLLVGILYKRYHTRYLPYYQGLAVVMPIYALLFMLTTFANISLPFCASFLAELFIIYSTYITNTNAVFILLASLIFSSTFMVWLTNRILFGTPSASILPPISNNTNNTLNPSLPITNNTLDPNLPIGGLKRILPLGRLKGIGALDISRIEFVSLLPLLFLIGYLAFNPSLALTYLYLPLTLLL